MRLSKLIFGLFCIVFSASCAGVTPQQNFVNAMNGHVGDNINEIPPYHAVNINRARSSLLLPNGNTEYEFFIHWRRAGDCVYSIEVDKETKKILHWKMVEDKGGCILIP